MSLVNLDNKVSDKNTAHSYLPLYDELLKDKKETATNILEVGVYGGGSIELWSKYFLGANIYGVELNSLNSIGRPIKDKKNIILHTNTNAYDLDFLGKLKDIKFDLVLDDGPHSLESQIFFVKHYSKLLKDDGILIVEDIQNIDHFKILTDNTPNELKQYIKTYDLRNNKNRYDDLVFSINLNLI
jgi:hypothetical protein